MEKIIVAFLSGVFLVTGLAVYYLVLAIKYHPDFFIRLLRKNENREEDQTIEVESKQENQDDYSLVSTHDYSKGLQKIETETQLESAPKEEPIFAGETKKEEEKEGTNSDNSRLDIDVEMEYEKTEDENPVDEKDEFIPCNNATGPDEVLSDSSQSSFEDLREAHRTATDENASPEAEQKACETLQSIEGTNIWEALVSQSPVYERLVSKAMGRLKKPEPKDDESKDELNIDEFYYK